MTLWGTSFAVADLYHLVEETLPDRFGGGPHAYQLVEEEEPGGLTHLRLLISPKSEAWKRQWFDRPSWLNSGSSDTTMI